MKIEDQVISWSLANKLHELKVNKESKFCWWLKDEYSHGVAYANARLFQTEEDMMVFPAYSVAELMEMIPAYIKIPGKEPFDCFLFSLKKCSTKHIQYLVNYYCNTTEAGDIRPRSLFLHNIYGEKLADVLANTLILVMDKVINNDKK